MPLKVWAFLVSSELFRNSTHYLRTKKKTIQTLKTEAFLLCHFLAWTLSEEFFSLLDDGFSGMSGKIALYGNPKLPAPASLHYSGSSLGWPLEGSVVIH